MSKLYTLANRSLSTPTLNTALVSPSTMLIVSGTKVNPGEFTLIAKFEIKRDPS